MTFKDQLDKTRLPKHIAIIMDGNGRWAQTKKLERVYGHAEGAVAVRRVVEACVEIGVENLSLYAFSTENWGRPKEEVDALMSLLVNHLKSEISLLMQHDIRLRIIGDIDRLDKDTKLVLNNCLEKTKDNNKMNLVLALSYGSRQEIVKSVKNIAKNVVEGKLDINDIDESLINQSLQTKFMPDPDLLIRTSGECRISNFMLWQIAYSELYFLKEFWPDFSKEMLYESIVNYQNRERRFGKTTAQLNEISK